MVPEASMPAEEVQIQLQTVTMVLPVGEGVDISLAVEEGVEVVDVTEKMEEKEDLLEAYVIHFV